MILLALGSEPFGVTAWPECVRQLGDREDPSVSESLALLLRHAGQHAEVVLFNRRLPASGLELACGTVSVQSQGGRRGAEKQRGDLLDKFADVTRQGRCL